MQAGAAALALSAATIAAAQTNTVRVSFVGVEGRRAGLLRQMLRWDNVAIADMNETNLARAQKMVANSGLTTPEAYSRGERDFKRLCKRNDLDLVV